MSLIPQDQIDILQLNHQAQKRASGCALDQIPVVKLYQPHSWGVWLVTEMSDDNDMLYGLYDFGGQTPRLGYVSMSVLMAMEGRSKVVRDERFQGDKPLSEYFRMARLADQIVA
jgi:hypothetical protein